MAELTQTKEIVGFVFAAIREAQRIARGGVQAKEITAGLAPGPFKDSLERAIDGADQVDDELRSTTKDWRAGTDLVNYISAEAQTLGDA